MTKIRHKQWKYKTLFRAFIKSSKAKLRKHLGRFGNAKTNAKAKALLTHGRCIAYAQRELGVNLRMRDVRVFKKLAYESIGNISLLKNVADDFSMEAVHDLFAQPAYAYAFH